MGRKGVSKRKPKKSKPFSKTDINGSSIARLDEQPAVKPLSEDYRASLNRGGMNPSAGGSNKKHKKGN